MAQADPGTEKDRLQELLAGPQKHLARVFVGHVKDSEDTRRVALAMVTGNENQLQGFISKSEDDDTMEPLPYRFPYTLDTIQLLPHLRALFSGFESTSARGRSFKNVMKHYVQSSFPQEFDSISDESMKARVEVEIMKESIKSRAVRFGSKLLSADQSSALATGTGQDAHGGNIGGEEAGVEVDGIVEIVGKTAKQEETGDRKKGKKRELSSVIESAVLNDKENAIPPITLRASDEDVDHQPTKKRRTLGLSSETNKAREDVVESAASQEVSGKLEGKLDSSVDDLLNRLRQQFLIQSNQLDLKNTELAKAAERLASKDDLLTKDAARLAGKDLKIGLQKKMLADLDEVISFKDDKIFELGRSVKDCSDLLMEKYKELNIQLGQIKQLEMKLGIQDSVEKVAPSNLPDTIIGTILRTNGQEYQQGVSASGSWLPGTWHRLIEKKTWEDGDELEHIKYICAAKVVNIGGIERAQMITPSVNTKLYIIGARPFKIGQTQFVEYEAWLERPKIETASVFGFLTR